MNNKHTYPPIPSDNIQKILVNWKITNQNNFVTNVAT